MKKQLINAISSGLHGEWTHTDPKRALAGLTPINAKKKSTKSTHSCWELLHHIIVWQDTIINNIKGENLDWREIESQDNWPTEESLTDDSNFLDLKNRFLAGIEEAQDLLKQTDFTEMSRGYPELPKIKLYITLLQHTSYHLGQIMSLRKNLGDWPPSKDNT